MYIPGGAGFQPSTVGGKNLNDDDDDDDDDNNSDPLTLVRVFSLCGNIAHLGDREN